jgi:hypothetical protein
VVTAGRAERLAPLALALVSLLPHARALWPDLTYYFRDFTVTFYPQRLFWARELGEGRWPWWNPYVHEGVPALPVLYPPDLLHVWFPGPAFVSWLLTLHFPLAALGAYALARDLGLGRAGAFVAGAVFSLSGLCLSSLNLYVFLQALALAPLLVLALRRAGDRGGRWVAVAAAVLALSLTTLAVEFVAQAVLLGILLGAADRPHARTAARLVPALAVGFGLAAVPVLVTAGILRESVRGAGFAPEVALGNAVHPAALLQAWIPDLFGPLAAPVEVWWGAGFFSKGFPYLLSLYLGPLALALAATGAAGPAFVRPRRLVLLAAGGLGLWYALGAPFGLAAAVSTLPGASSFRFPSKAMLLPVFSVALLAGAGAHALARGEGWRRLGWACAGVAVPPLAVAGLVTLAGPQVARWAALPEALAAAALRTVALQGLQAGLLALAGLLLAVLAVRGRLPSRVALAVVCLLAVGDLARAGRGLNPQAPPALFALLPELAAERLDALDGGRVFSLGLDESPAFRRFLGSGAPGRGLWSFFLSRQMLVPYASALDRVETAHGKDLTSFVPLPAALETAELAPERVGEIAGRLRAAAVVRVLSLDPLSHPDFRLRVRAPAGPPQMWVHLFDLRGAEPRWEVRCAAAAPPCRFGTVRASRLDPARREYAVEAEGDSELLLRDAYARGWRAWVDGRETAVRRAGDGRHQSVALPPGRHHVRLSYAPPGLRGGLAVTVLSLAAAAVLARKPLV